MKKPVLPFFVTRTVKGREYCYYERGKERIRLPHYSEPHFHAAYADAISGKSPPKPKHTWSGLIDRYKRSDRFNGLKPRTREDYERYMAYIAQTIGDKDPARMTTPHIYDMLDANRHRVRFANYVVQVMSVLLAHAKRIGWVQHNAATGVEKLKSSSEPVNRPWTPETIEAFLGHADDRARLVFEMCYGTGQRIGDVLAMKWSDIQDGEIQVKQNKTEAELVIPLTDRLIAYLSTVERKGQYVIAQDLRRPITRRQAWGAVKKALRAGGVDGTLHGLRYTVAAEMAANGASDEEIAAITGHESLAMVKKYAGAARQIARARAAQKRRG